MKKIILLAALLVTWCSGFACEVCQKQQPKVLRGITHGAGPQSNWDYVIVIAMALIVLAALFYSIRYLIKPGEKSSDHIKRTVLTFEYDEFTK